MMMKIREPKILNEVIPSYDDMSAVVYNKINNSKQLHFTVRFQHLIKPINIGAC